MCTRRNPILHLCLPAVLFLGVLLGCSAGRQQAAEKQSASTIERPAGVLVRLREPGRCLRWPSAHRGDRESGPDNSLEAILAAARVGVPLIEIDVRTNKDGTLFLFHDGELKERNFSGPREWIGRRVESLTDKELVRLCQPGRPDLRVLRFSEALAAVADYDTVLQLDLKGESAVQAEAVIAAARASGQIEQILVQCQSPITLVYVRGKHPDVAVLSRCRSDLQVKMAYAHRPEIIQVDDDWASDELIRDIHAHGSKILAKSMGSGRDAPQHWQKLFDRGMDILMTDRAAAMAQYLKPGEQGARLVPGAAFACNGMRGDRQEVRLWPR